MFNINAKMLNPTCTLMWDLYEKFRHFKFIKQPPSAEEQNSPASKALCCYAQDPIFESCLWQIIYFFCFIMGGTQLLLNCFK